MHIPPKPFFDSDVLKAAFVQDAIEALADKHISQDDLLFLQTLTDPKVSAVEGGVARVDRLRLANGQGGGSELASALVISHKHSDNAQVYLYTPLYGLEAFENRRSMLSVLQLRFRSVGEDVLPEFDVELVDGPLFESWMLTLVDFDVTAVDALCLQLEGLPTLRSAMAGLLKHSITRVAPAANFNADSIFLQIVQLNSSPGQTLATEVIAVQTLLDTALDIYSGNDLIQGQSRLFLGSNGQALDAGQAGTYEQILSQLTTEVVASVEQTLLDYWAVSPISKGPSRHVMMAQALSESFRHALLGNKADARLTLPDYQKLRALLPGYSPLNEPGITMVRRLAVVFAGNQALKLVGMFTVEFVNPNAQSVWLFSAQSGLRCFHDRDALIEYFMTATGRAFLFAHLSFNDHALAAWSGTLTLEYTAIEGELFMSLAGTVIAFQQRNVSFVLKRAHVDRQEAAVMLDDALDIRRLLDPRLLLRNVGGRWRSKPRSFVPHETDEEAESISGEQTVKASVIESTVLPSDSDLVLDDSWMTQLQSLDALVSKISLARPGVEQCARELLNKQLCVFADPQLDAAHIHLQLPVNDAGHKGELISLVGWLLECVTGARSGELAQGTLFVVPCTVATAPWQEVSVKRGVLDRAIKRAQAQFPSQYLHQVRQFHLGPVRQHDRQLEPGPLSCSIRDRQLRMLLTTERRRNVINPQALNMLEQLLNRPLQRLRSQLGHEAVQVCSVHLEGDPSQSVVVLSNTMVFHQPAHADGPVVFWSAVKGLRVYNSLAVLEAHFNQWIRRSKEQHDWLALLAAEDRALVSSFLKRASAPLIRIETQAIEDHFISELQRMEQRRQYQSIEGALLFAKRLLLDNAATVAVTHAVEITDANTTILDTYSIKLQALFFEASLPDWIRKASDVELNVYSELVAYYFRTVITDHDFLFGVPKLREFAREKLLMQLNIDFPNQTFDPDTIIVRYFRYITAGTIGADVLLALPAATEDYSETLTDFVLGHIGASDGFSLSVSSTDAQQTLTGFTPPYLNTLVRTLDIGGNYQNILEEKLSSSSADYAKRLGYFCDLLPAQMFETAFQQKLEGILSNLAWRYVERVVNMPDNLARLPVFGTTVVLRPFKLVAAPGWQADLASGIYLFGPADSTQGPLVLHAIFHDAFCFKEFANEAELLLALRSDSELQELILQRLSPQARDRYDYGGFREPHLPSGIVTTWDSLPLIPAPPTLSQEAVEGNALQFFFRDTITVMKLLAKNQTVTAAQASWSAFTYLLTLAGEQAFTFLPGKLGSLVAAWQSGSWFQASFTAASAQRWGKALSEFSAGLAMLLSSRAAHEEELVIDSEENAQELSLPQPTDFSWQNNNMNAELNARLRTFEVIDVELKTLVKDPLLNLYGDHSADKYYAAVGGKVFQVRQERGQWWIVDKEQSGPPIRLDPLQHWQLDLQSGLLGGGPILSRRKSSLTDEHVDNVFVTEASGMPEIRSRYRERARQIGEGHLLAKRYVQDALDNLRFPDSHAVLDDRVADIIKAFFDVETVSQPMLLLLQTKAKKLFDEILDASLSPFSSPRYVVGANKIGHEQTLGFTVKTDARKRIFFTERFFHTPSFRLVNSVMGRRFNVGAHHRGAILIHEVSHQVLDTHDITYVESSSPFNDLLSNDSLGLAILKRNLRDMQQVRLSWNTVRGELFRVYQPGGGWRDLDAMDGDGKAGILKVAGESSLEKARDVFYSDSQKRCEIMLLNADSVTLLMTKLGRQLFT